MKISIVLWTRFRGIESVELGDSFLGVTQTIGRFPSIRTRIVVPRPSDEILETSPMYSGIQYGGDFVFGLGVPFDLYRRWGFNPSPRNHVGGVTFKERDVKDRMDF